MSAGNPFSQIAPTDEGQNTTPASATGNPFSAIAATLPNSTDTPPANGPWYDVNNEHNLQQLGDAAIGAGKSIVKGLGVVGDVATLGLTHLLPGSEKASAGINAPGTALAPTNDDQRYGGYVGDAANFELGSGIMESLSKLPLAERVIQAAKAMKVFQEHPVLAKIAADTLKGAATGGAGTLVATGSPTDAAEGAATGAVIAPIAGAVSKGVAAIRDLYKPLETAESVQPVVQNAIKDVAGKVAADAGVDGPSSLSIRDTVNDVAENVKTKSQPVFQKLDELSNGKFSDAQAAAKRYRGAIDKAGKDAYAEAIEKQNQIFDSVKGKLDPDALDKAKASWKQYNALADVSDAIQKSVSGTRPEVAAASSALQPAETINPKVLAGKLNALYNDGTLTTAFGKNAHTILDHVGAAQQKLVSIADNLTAQQAKKRVVKAVAIRTGSAAAGTAVGGGALLHTVLGGGKH